MTSPKTIVTARYTNPGHRNTSSDYTERRVSFDLHLPARVCELVGFGLLWEMGLAPVPEFAEVSSEHRDGDPSPADHPANAVASQAVENAAKIAELTAWLSTNAGDDARAGEHGVDVALRLLKRHYAPKCAELPDDWAHGTDKHGPRILGPDGECIALSAKPGHLFIRDDDDVSGQGSIVPIAALRAFLALLDAERA